MNNVDVIGNNFCTIDDFFVSVDNSLSTVLPPSFAALMFVSTSPRIRRLRRKLPRLLFVRLFGSIMAEEDGMKEVP
jgi:hypothetical protein